MKQPELFEDLGDQSQQPRLLRFPTLASRFLRLKIAYEDLIFGGLSLVLILLAGFCLGVERGRRLEPDWPAIELVSGQATAAAPVVAHAPAPVRIRRSVPAIPVAVSPAPAAALTQSQPAGQYAIQLASFVSSPAAQGEAKRLLQKGIRCAVLPQGKYFELRAVGFVTQEQARSALSGLRKTYRDAFIKKVF